MAIDEGVPVPTQTTRKKRGPYARSARTRQLAVDAAIDLFSTNGYRGTTLTDVADRLEMTLTGLQYHFRDKDALLTAVLEDRDSAAKAREGHEEDPVERFLDVVVYNEENRELTALFCVLSSEATDPHHPAHGFFVQRYREQREAGVKYYQALIDSGAVSGATSAETFAAQLIAMSDGLQLQWLLDPKRVDMRGAMRRYLTLVLQPE